MSSYYADRRSPRRPRSSLTGDKTARVAILGGGLAGLTAAFNLSQAGLEPILLEAKTCGWGASGRNAGFVGAGYAAGLAGLERRLGLAHAQKLYALSRRGVSWISHQISRLGQENLIAGQGALKVLRHDDPKSLAAEQRHLVDAYGAQVEFWPLEAIRETLATDRYFAALHDAEAFQIDPLAYATALANAAEAAGTMIFEKTRGERLERIPGMAGNGGWIIETNAGQIKADHVILAGSAYQAGLYRPLERTVLPVATFVTVSEPLGERLDEVIRFPGAISDTRRAGHYYRVVGAGDQRRLLWGGGITTSTREPSGLRERFAVEALKLFPDLGRFQMEFAWSGLMGYSRAKMPMIGLLQGRPESGLWAATAFGGHGLNTTAVGGTLVAEAILGVNESWRLFEAFLPGFLDRFVGGGSRLGKAMTQLEYWRLQALDGWAERG